MIIYSIY